MQRSIIYTILWSGKGKANFVFAAVGFLIGFVMLLLAVHLYKNVFEPINKELKTENASSFIIINKEVDISNSIGLTKSNFSDREIETIRSQPFVKRLGIFTSNQFKASVSIAGIGGSELPVESVETFFLDTIPPGWEWAPGDETVPIILSNEFVNLYNFVMAPSWHTPQMPKEAVNQFSMDLFLSGSGKSKQFHAKVVGYSDRIVSVLVPQGFMSWANAEFSNEKEIKPNRIILEVTDPSDKKLTGFLEKNGYETNRDKLKSNARSLVSILIIIITVFGSLLFTLALFLFLTTFSLLIARQRNDIELLFQIGYDIRYIRSIWIKRFSLLLILLFAASFLILFFMNYAIVQIAIKQSLVIEKNIHVIVFITGVLLLAAVLLYNRLRIQRSLLSIYQ